MLTPKLIALACVGCLVVGSLGGYGLRAATTDSGPTLSRDYFRQSLVIDPHLEAMRTGDRTPEGAAKAATTFISGFIVLADKPEGEIRRLIDESIVTEADPNLRTNLLTVVGNVRDRLYGNDGRSVPNARLVMAPATYKVEMVGENQARVSVWYMTVFLQANGKVVQSSWTTDTLGLRWKDSWRVATYEAKQGPSPRLSTESGNYSSFEEMATVFDGYKPYRSALSAK